MRKTIARNAVDDKLRDLAATIYHESRHCQQTFWMMSLFFTYPDDYVQLPGISTMFKYSALESIKVIAEKTPFPNDNLVKIGVHPMLIFYYWWFIVAEKVSSPGFKLFDPMFADADKVQAEVCKLRSVTPEQAQLMGQYEPGYRSHYHEEDAYATEDAVKQYWRDPNHSFFSIPVYAQENTSKSSENSESTEMANQEVESKNSAIMAILEEAMLILRDDKPLSKNYQIFGKFSSFEKSVFSNFGDEYKFQNEAVADADSPRLSLPHARNAQAETRRSSGASARGIRER
ncbi:hypothetical protein F4827_003987 [Paraburkholderia bannensis]|uniref:Uncharacterized protein n=1 Tax=Paraburkholderia bannensis TaxID=765414 RepID=A0A7W9WUT6_9BURK|nr:MULTISPECIES: hypothetical protein [Paraburkholderia]MBB3259113.1 hypothetical protein [Paraburkholderia sp. WP4_3_2]MBB6104128.1 hypothetical protein [Paraburkholderia bannensis]